MSCRKLLGLPERRLTFRDGLETEPGIPCIDPSGGGCFGPVAEQSPLTGDEPNNLIQISSQHTPVNFPSRRNIFSADFNGVPTTAASDDTDTLDAGMASPLFTQEREDNSLSGSAHRQAVVSGSSHTAAIIIQCQLCMDTHVVRSCGKLQQSDGSDVEKSLLNGKRDGEFGSASSQKQERFLSERQKSP